MECAKCETEMEIETGVEDHWSYARDEHYQTTVALWSCECGHSEEVEEEADGGDLDYDYDPGYDYDSGW